MQEVIRLLEAIDETQSAGLGSAIATVVRVKGSAYRREGTKMLIDASGNQVCMISGGCLEQEVADIAQQVMASGEPKVHFFDLNEDLVWGLGLGCGGAVDVYIEPFDKGQAHSLWLGAIKRQEAACLATLIEVDSGSSLVIGQRMFIGESLVTTGSLGDSYLDSQVLELAKGKMAELYPRSFTKIFEVEGKKLSIFLDLTVPPSELLIFGAGHDAIPMASFAHSLGFNVSVIDARHAFVTKERFPEAKQLIRTHPSGFSEKLSLGPRSYAVVMNHHLERDKESLKFLLTTPVPYIGILGPRKRYEEMLDALTEEGFSPDPEGLKRVRNPIGVDVGAETPEEVAVSVMSELLALRGGYEAGFLHNRSGRIHVRLES